VDMEVLPKNFPTDELTTIEKIQLEWFYTKYTEEYFSSYFYGHMILAAYAAVPAYLTPDLLSKIWQNFGEYTWGSDKRFIHRMAISDILLAPFCKQVSYEVYQMNRNTRLHFLKWMNSDAKDWIHREPKSVNDIAHFVEEYHQHPNSTILREGYRYLNEQIMEAKAYYEPEVVARYFMEQLKGFQNQQNNNEIVEILNAIERAKSKEQFTNQSTVFSNMFEEGVTQVWKNSILENVHTLSNYFTNNTIGPAVITKQSKTEFDIPIKIEKTKTTVISKFEDAVAPKYIAYLIGVTQDDESNIHEVENILINNTHWKTAISKHRVTSSKMLLDAIKMLTNEAAQNDHIILYLSVQQATLTTDGHCRFGVNAQEWITDVEVQIILETLQAKTVLLILDGQLYATPYWINTQKNGRSLLANVASTNNLRNGNNSSAETSTQGSHLIKAILSKMITETDTLRNVYVEIVKDYDTQQGISLRRVPDFQTAMLQSNRTTIATPFTKTSANDLQVQQALRLTGYLSEKEYPYWEATSATTALEAFANRFKLKPDVYEVLPKLEELLSNQQYQSKAIFVFIYQDEVNQLSAIDREVTYIKNEFKNSDLGKYNEIKVFKNRTLEEINRFMALPQNRNRIQFIYYGGKDQNGLPYLYDQQLDLTCWQQWLAFQNRMELVVLNNCYSAKLALQLTQIGVAAALGHQGNIMDDEAADFCLKLLAHIAEGLPFADF